MKSEYIMILVWADLNKRKIYVPRKLMERVHILNSAEAQLYFTYRNRYPDFEVMVGWVSTNKTTYDCPAPAIIRP